METITSAKTVALILAFCLASTLPARADQTGDESLYVTSTPDSASIYINETYYGVAPLKISSLAAGSVTIKAVKERCLTWQQRVAVQPGRINTVHVQLTLAKGGLSVTSVPSGGRIYLNDKPIGETPMSINNLITGRYAVRISHPDRADYGDSITIETDRTVRIQAVLSVRNELFIESTPLGAEVSCNNRVCGKTPCTIPNLADGIYLVRVVRDGHRAWNDSVLVRNGGTQTVRAELTPLYGRLSIESEPTGARLFVNDVAHGTTPQIVDRLSFAAYKVRMEKEGYEPIARSVVVDAERTFPLTVELLRRGTGLAVVANVTGADAYLDDVYLGTTPIKDFQAAPGPHRLSVSKPGFEAVKREFALAPDALRREVVVELAARTPAKSLARSLVLPGWGQYYTGHTEKALLATAAAAGCLALTGWYLYAHDHLQDDYSQAMTAYRTAITSDDITATRAKTKNCYEALDRNSRKVSICAALAAGVWLLNMADAYWLSPADQGRATDYLSGQGVEAGFCVDPPALTMKMYAYISLEHLKK
jgi:hypothetical protein